MLLTDTLLLYVVETAGWKTSNRIFFFKLHLRFSLKFFAKYQFFVHSEIKINRHFAETPASFGLAFRKPL